MDESRVEEGVAVVVLHLSNATAAVDKDLVKPTVLWSVWIAETEMPFSEYRTVVAIGFEELRQGLLVFVENGSSGDSGENPRAHRIAAG